MITLIRDQTLIHGECLEEMDKLIARGIVVDAIICDVPYGTTNCKWDVVIPFDAMWHRLNKLIKPNGAIVLFGSEPFSSALRMSNVKNFKYDWIWEKQKANNFLTAKHQPLKMHEIISVFNTTTYNPQKYKVIEITDIIDLSKNELISWMKRRLFDRFGVIDRRKKANDPITNKDTTGIAINRVRNLDDGTRYPKSVIKINKDARNVHPTQKPVPLMEYLIKTYTDENATVLDFAGGSGTTAVACDNTNRKSIVIEIRKDAFDDAVDRVTDNESSHDDTDVTNNKHKFIS